jgi:hypothetical protein
VRAGLLYLRVPHPTPAASPAFKRAFEIVTSARVRSVQAMLTYAVELSNKNHAPVQVFVERLNGEGLEVFVIPADFSGGPRR